MPVKKNTTKNGENCVCRIRRKVGMRPSPKTGKMVPWYKDFYGSSKTEAENKATAFIEELNRKASDRTFGELMESFISVFLRDETLKESTRRLYVDAYRNTLFGSALTACRIGDVTGAMIQREIDLSNRGATTLRNVRILLTRFYKYLQNQGITCFDFSAGIVIPKPERRRKPGEPVETFSNDEMAALMGYFDEYREKHGHDHRIRFLVLVCLNCGLRISEALGLKYSDIDGDILTVRRQVVKAREGSDSSEHFTTGPTKSPAAVRSVPFAPNMLDELNRYRKEQAEEMLRNGYRTEFIFTTSSGKLYDHHNVRMALKRAERAAGVPERSFHAFRHTFGTRLAASGVPIQDVAALMGHNNVSVTSQYYISVSTDTKRNAILRMHEAIQPKIPTKGFSGQASGGVTGTHNGRMGFPQNSHKRSRTTQKLPQIANNYTKY